MEHKLNYKQLGQGFEKSLPFYQIIMETVHIVMTGLAVLDIGIMLLARWFDRKYYIPLMLAREQSVSNNFFVNKAFDEPLNRFMLSKGGSLLILLIFISIVVLTIKIPDGTF